MKKSFIYASIFAGCLLTFNSCTKDENLELYMGDNFSTDAQKMIDAINTLSYPTGFSPSDDEHPEYKNMDPEVYSDKKTTENRRIEGYYGYVDLGLSVKWATSNLGSVSPVNEQRTLEEIFQEIEEGMDLQPVDKPSFATDGSNTYPKTINYDDYQKIKEVYNAYSSYCYGKTLAHDEAIEKYNRLQAENHQYLFAGGDTYPWGGTSMWGFIAINGTTDAPANIAGNPEYDAATHILGDGWSIPTKEQWQELIDRCQWEKKDGHYIVTGPSGKQIVLPCLLYHTAERTDGNACYLHLDDTKDFKFGELNFRIYIRPVHTK